MATAGISHGSNRNIRCFLNKETVSEDCDVRDTLEEDPLSEEATVLIEEART